MLNKRMGIIIISQVVISAILGVFIYVILNSNSGNSVSGNYQHIRETANKLHASGIITEAIDLYEEYLELAQIDNATRAKMAFSIGSLYDQESEYEKALSWYYQVETVDPDSKYIKDAAKRIVALLEKLKKFQAAKHALRDNTRLDKDTGKKGQGGTIVAKVEGRPIYLHTVNEEIDQLPEAIKKQFSTLEGKKNYIQKYVADELMLKKAYKLQYDKDAQIRKQIERVTKGLLVQKIVTQEISNKISADESDIKNYFEANKEKYVQKKRALVSWIKIKQKKKANKIIKELEGGKDFSKMAKEYSIDSSSKDKGGALKELIDEDTPPPAGNLTMSKAVLKLKEGQWTSPLLYKGHYYILKSRKLYPMVRPQYSQVKDRVQYEYKMVKSQELYQKMISQMLKTEEVTLYLDKVK